MAKCFECGEPATFNHHVVPKSLGGTNTVPLCSSCHPKAHGETGHWELKKLVKEALQAKKKQGHYIGGNLGYGRKRAKSGEIAIDHAELATACWMVDMRLHGYTYVEIASMLEQRGIKTTKGKKRWRPWRVNEIVKRLLGAAAVGEGS
jgi:hypothetical protein